MSDEGWNELQDMMVSKNLIKKKLAPSEIYTNQFVEDKVLPRRVGSL